MKTRHDYYESIRKYAIEPKFIIPITNIRSLIIKSIVNDIVVGIEYYEGYRIEERDIHFYKVKSECIEVADNEYEINYYFVYRKKKYYFKDLYEKKDESWFILVCRDFLVQIYSYCVNDSFCFYHRNFIWFSIIFVEECENGDWLRSF